MLHTHKIHITTSRLTHKSYDESGRSQDNLLILAVMISHIYFFYYFRCVHMLLVVSWQHPFPINLYPLFSNQHGQYTMKQIHFLTCHQCTLKYITNVPIIDFSDVLQQEQYVEINRPKKKSNSSRRANRSPDIGIIRLGLELWMGLD